MSDLGLPDPAMARFSWNTGFPAFHPYRLPPLLVKIPDDNDRPTETGAKEPPMSPNGRRAWRRAAKKLRCKMGRRWRSQEEWVHGKRWSELVPDLAAHRGHISGPWFKRHGFQSLDPESSSRHYIGLSGTVDGDTIGFVEAARPFTARSLVGMTMGARKRAVRKAQAAVLVLLKGQPADPVKFTLLRRLLYRIGERLRPCPGCCHCWGHRISEHGECCGPQTLGKRNSQIKAMRKWENNPQGANCDGSGVLPARRSK